MKKKLLVGLVIVSLGVNLFVFGDWLLVKRGTQPTAEEEIALSEMVLKTVESTDYQTIAGKEKIIAIDRGMDTSKGGAFPYYFGVNVYTDTQTHIFACADTDCSAMKSAGTMYSIYKDEDPRLPFDQ
ncbi:hypothetical protein BBH88_18650 (plasmid) [Planococcus antarcticus DSM 14505]|uniref:Uncharacterized protein n=1 Tax=Planococcus antarcticus DSM 14505 TaxID=1185653 RepID=A0ABN4RP96_9BACL|nr:hypothetical protein [Planococcus antarcticus]ANU12303.1 hypothetical protein BBH88_18535 [Planococcus antarcticus DSM 14505]ANU12323.1 hypothetical protein BBH88_18650 [Planococcus antarcticus DSM 14505]